MRMLIAPDSFKGSLTALEAARRMAEGAARVFPTARLDLVPLADGGEGTVDALIEATAGLPRVFTARDPLGRPIRAVWGLLGDGRGAVVETSAASGLTLLGPGERDACRASTYGTGELILAALTALHQAGPHDAPPRLIIGLGGSATNDAGTGALSALGVRFLDQRGRELPPGGEALARLVRIDASGMHPLVARTKIYAACDVDNPLCGPRGASAVFGPQKGADPAAVARLDAALAVFAAKAREATGLDCDAWPGAGAAGGFGAGLLFFAGARLTSGAKLIMRAVDFESRVAEADLVLTGEGLTDGQSAGGKVPQAVGLAAKALGKPAVCLSGALGPGAEALLDHGIDALASAVPAPIALNECMDRAGELLTQASERLCRLLAVGGRLHLV